MTLSTRIAPFLPYLRRYSRALTGSQTSGDAYVAAVLEALIADTSIFPEASSDRVALFRLFTSMFGSSSVLVPGRYRPLPGNSAHPSTSRRSRRSHARRSCSYRSKRSRHGSRRSTRCRRRQAGRTSRPRIPGNFPSGCNRDHDHRGRAADRDRHRANGRKPRPQRDRDRTHQGRSDRPLRDDEAEHGARRHPARGGSSGIDAVNEILKTAAVPVIFITAFPERLLTGERPEPTFLVTKPFNPEMVKALISQALFFNETTKAAA